MSFQGTDPGTGSLWELIQQFTEAAKRLQGPPAARDVTQASLGALTTEQPETRDLGETVRLAWDKLSQKQEGTTGFAAQEGIGPDLVNALSNILNVAGDPVQGANPVGPGLGAFKVLLKNAPKELSESAAKRGLGNIPTGPQGRFTASAFDPEAPGRGLFNLHGSVTKRPQAEGFNLVIDQATSFWTDPKNIGASSKSLVDAMKRTPGLTQMVAESILPRGMKVDEFIGMIAEAEKRGLNLKNPALLREFLESLHAQGLTEVTSITPFRLLDELGNKAPGPIKSFRAKGKTPSRTRHLSAEEIAEFEAKGRKAPVPEDKSVMDQIKRANK